MIRLRIFTVDIYDFQVMMNNMDKTHPELSHIIKCVLKKVKMVALVTHPKADNCHNMKENIISSLLIKTDRK